MYRDEKVRELQCKKASALGYELRDCGVPGYSWTGISKDQIPVEEVLAKLHDYSELDAFWEAKQKFPKLEVCPKVAWSRAEAIARTTEFRKWRRKRGIKAKECPHDPRLV